MVLYLNIRIYLAIIMQLGDIFGHLQDLFCRGHECFPCLERIYGSKFLASTASKGHTEMVTGLGKKKKIAEAQVPVSTWFMVQTPFAVCTIKRFVV